MTPSGASPAPAGPRRRILLVEESPVIGAAFRACLRESGMFEGDDILHAARADMPAAGAGAALLVADPAAWGLDAPGIAAEAAVAAPGAVLVAWSSDASPDLARACLEAGFRAFVSRAASGAQLAVAVAVALGGGVYLEKELAALALGLEPAAASEPSPAGAALSARERLVLRGVAAGSGQKEVARLLGISPKSVWTYKARGMRKLGLSGREDLLRHALREGWLD